MQFCSKSELYQSVKTCTNISAETAAHTVVNANSPRRATLVSANIDPVVCGDQFDFPCWSVAHADLRRALQNEMPSDLQSLLKHEAVQNVDHQAFFAVQGTGDGSTTSVTRNASSEVTEDESVTGTDSQNANISISDLFPYFHK